MKKPATGTVRKMLLEHNAHLEAATFTTDRAAGSYNAAEYINALCEQAETPMLVPAFALNHKGRVVTDVHQATGKLQTGYTHRCEYHALTFQGGQRRESAQGQVW